jgi:hypothetical protein
MRMGRLSTGRHRASSRRGFLPVIGRTGSVTVCFVSGSDGRTITEALSEGVQDREPSGKCEVIDAWMRGELANGPVKSTELEARAIEDGYSRDQLRRSKVRVAQTHKSGREWMTGLKAT